MGRDGVKVYVNEGPYRDVCGFNLSVAGAVIDLSEFHSQFLS